MLIYYLVPGKLRNLLLFLGSLIFYAWGEPVYVILMLFSSVFNYYMGAELERLYYDDRKQKINLIFSIIVLKSGQDLAGVLLRDGINAVELVPQPGLRLGRQGHYFFTNL
jgi:D-alanyl-lipoteichoic acid acyltransferase DltB (MBOAT superfamily)